MTRSYALRTRASCARCTLCLYLPYVCGNRVVSWHIAVAAQGSKVQQHHAFHRCSAGVGWVTVRSNTMGSIPFTHCTHCTLYTLPAHQLYLAIIPHSFTRSTQLTSLHIPYPAHLPPYQSHCQAHAQSRQPHKLVLPARLVARKYSINSCSLISLLPS